MTDSIHSIHASLLNYTPHTITLIDDMGTSPIKSDGVARATEIIEPAPMLHWCIFGDCGMHDDVKLVRKRFGDVTGLPGPRRNILYIVSQVVFDALPDRTDLLVPHDMVRDEQGRIIGCRGFAGRI